MLIESLNGMESVSVVLISIVGSSVTKVVKSSVIIFRIVDRESLPEPEKASDSVIATALTFRFITSRSSGLKS